MLVYKVAPVIDLNLAELAHKTQMHHSSKICSAELPGVALYTVEVLPLTEHCAHGRANEEVRLFFLEACAYVLEPPFR